jgi:hypothetical protein
VFRNFGGTVAQLQSNRDAKQVYAFWPTTNQAVLSDNSLDSRKLARCAGKIPRFMEGEEPDNYLSVNDNY